MDQAAKQTWESSPIISGKKIKTSPAQPITSPSNLTEVVGHVYEATADDIEMH